MIVGFKKDSAGNFVLHCIRRDGTETWQKYHWGMFQVEHDITHYVVETTLGYSEAFYGLLASGKDISWFAEPDLASGGIKKPRPPEQAMQAEILVGALQGMKSDEEFFAHFPATFRELGVAVPEITSEQVKSIREQVKELVQRWQGSKEGVTVEFAEHV